MEKKEIDDFEIQDVEEYRHEKDLEFSHQSLVMQSMRKVLELASKELREGFWNRKQDRAGNTVSTYSEDTRSAFIESVKTCLMIMACDIDETAKGKIEGIQKDLEDKRKELLNQEETDWNNFSQGMKQAFFNKDLGFNKGYFNANKPYYKSYMEFMIQAHRNIFAELSRLTSRLDFFKSSDVEA